MLAHCAQCGVRFLVPDERAATPNLRVRCRCGAEFPLHAPHSRAAAAVAAPGTPEAPPPPENAALRGGAWRRCLNHPQAKSESVCPACGVGFCRECERRVNNVPVCPRCEGLCSDLLKVEEDQARDKQRARTMQDDIGFIAGYPFSDRAAYIMLALFTWFFSFFSGMPLGVILSKGVLVWYCFTALTRVAIGKFRGFMPNFGDITDIVHPMRLSFAAFLAASWPLLALPFLVGPPVLPSFLESMESRADGRGVVYAQEPAAVPEGEFAPEAGQDGGEDESEDESEDAEGVEAAAAPPAEDEAGSESESRSPILVNGLYALAFLWQLLYLPMALIVAAISRGFFKTLNPLIGVEAIGKMGSAYWFAVLLYTILATLQALLGRLLDVVPIAGSLVGSFLAAYVSLTTGCALGLAVFKKAKELDLD